ncbi:uncharacterized protein [Drosophila pseudoobscura]|uniref:Uncharacterized protein isoform X2 n=1 Tax=Drosophila pseudoobscura pseudoobscura TaxID=46245 RepID=A0A6I8VBK3_DROPS|nr:uncharacterized protein LOC4802347 isoform X2 [Drosophila pseudoobscura]
MTNQKIPEWVNGLSLKQAIHATLGDGEKILDVTPVIDEIQYRNCTVLLPISAKVLMMDQTLRKITFMLKAQHCSKFQARIMTHLKLFAREDHMYHKVLPKLERMFQSVGKTVTFGPRAFKLDKSIKVHYILMEDLRTKGYQNVCRQEGFDLVSIKAVLKKLAEFHAASAVYVERHGMFGKLLADGVYTRNNRNILKKLNDVDPFLSQLRGSSLASRFHKRLINKERVLVDRMLEMHSRQTLTDFCVLNHCDGWVNNVMLKFDSFGKVEDTALIDYQVVRPTICTIPSSPLPKWRSSWINLIILYNITITIWWIISRYSTTEAVRRSSRTYAMVSTIMVWQHMWWRHGYCPLQ